jgi:hypothetical protein
MVMNPNSEPGEKEIACCDCCGYETEVKTYNNPSINSPGEAKLCEICARTYIGNAFFYSYPEMNLYRSLGWIGNHILNEIRELRKFPVRKEE